MNRIDPILVATVLSWSPKVGPKPEVDLESWAQGLRVKMTYRGVETGLLFDWGTHLNEPAVTAELDRVFDILCWRVTPPPATP